MGVAAASSQSTSTAPMGFFVGTSGYSYPKWKGSFYPENLPQKAMLSYYAQQFHSVELNNTFRRMPSESDVQSWVRQVTKPFRFAIKAPQSITHFKRLKNAKKPTSQLFHAMAAFGPRRGPVLFQLPPNFKKDLPRLKAFLRLVPKRCQAAIEFRHESWFAEDVFDCLRARRCALCIADAEDLPPQQVIDTAGWGYVRLRRERYTDKSLAKWVEQLKSQDWHEAYVFFKHEDTGTGPKFAANFLKQLDK